MVPGDPGLLGRGEGMQRDTVPTLVTDLLAIYERVLAPPPPLAETIRKILEENKRNPLKEMWSMYTSSFTTHTYPPLL